ncbi:MAG: cytosine deaminase [Cyanobacteria bacterium J06598_3]
MTSFLQIPHGAHYWLCNGRVPLTLLTSDVSCRIAAALSAEGRSNDDAALVLVDIEVRDGAVVTVQPATDQSPIAFERDDVPRVDVRSGLIWPCFVDVHTHLDKGHIWPRSPNPDGTFGGALGAVRADSDRNWHAEDVYRRAEFGLKCSYAHGTQAIRTHLDSFDGQGDISFEVFRQLRSAWQGKIALQAVCLVTLDYFMGDKGDRLADLVAESGGILGGVAFANGGLNAEIVQQIDRAFELAKARGLDLDFHTDESLDPGDMALRHVAEAAIRHGFAGRVTCGHCCSLSVQSDEERGKTIALVKAAGISVVSLPMCNLYLQNRQAGQTPRYRGVTLLHELKAAGVPVALASDNCRDPFFAYGDHDGLEVFTQSARIGHLDHPIGAWPQSVTRVPADMMGLAAGAGLIGEGGSADFVVFKARNFNELMSRPQGDRTVIRHGQQIDTTLPDYAELDDLMH